MFNKCPIVVRYFCKRIIPLTFKHNPDMLPEHAQVNLYSRQRHELEIFLVWWKEGKVSFNDALNAFYLRLYGVRHMVKDHSESEKGNPLPPHRLLFPINSKGYFICIIPQTG